MKKRNVLVAVLGSLLALGVIVGTTLAYLTATADPVTNTFTVGKIEIDLDEPNYEEPVGGTKLYPGAEIDKDPTVTVKANSERSYVYMLLRDELNFVLSTDPVVNAISLNLHANWQLVATDGNRRLFRFHLPVENSATDQALTPLFTEVKVNTLVTSANIGNLENGQLIISAYAHQAIEVTQAAADAAAKLHFTMP